MFTGKHELVPIGFTVPWFFQNNSRYFRQHDELPWIPEKMKGLPGRRRLWICLFTTFVPYFHRAQKPLLFF
ncbi:hypothetical protein M3J09_001490 [Ascochyta lentis]